MDITVDLVLRARGILMKDKFNVLGDMTVTVTEMLQEFSLETVYEVTHWFGKRFKG